MTTTATLHPSPPPRRFAVIGGDRRMLYLSLRLAEAGHTVRLLGCGGECLPPHPAEGDIRLCTSPEKALEYATDIVLPLPATRDGLTVWCPREPDCTVPLAELRDRLAADPRQRLWGGRLPASLTASLPTTQYVDYYDSESLQMGNAYITAEAALESAMELTEGTLRGSTVAVIGYGRIGKLLSRLLLALGVQVTVCARREEALLWAAAEGCHPLRLGDSTRPGGGLFPLCYGHAVIFNTVPHRVLEREVLLRMEPGTLILDLASAPFGITDEDMREAATTGTIRYVRAPSLPGTYAPREAGRIITDAILSHPVDLDPISSFKEGGTPS